VLAPFTPITAVRRQPHEHGGGDTTVRLDQSFGGLSPGGAPQLQMRRVEALLNVQSAKLGQLGQTLLFGNWFLCIGRYLRILNTIDPFVELQVRRFCGGYYHLHKRDLSGIEAPSEQGQHTSGTLLESGSEQEVVEESSEEEEEEGEEEEGQQEKERLGISEEGSDEVDDSLSVVPSSIHSDIDKNSSVVPAGGKSAVELDSFANRKVWSWKEWTFFSSTVKGEGDHSIGDGGRGEKQVNERHNEEGEKKEGRFDYLVGINSTKNSRIALPALTSDYYFYRASASSKFLRLDVRQVKNPQATRVAPPVLGYCFAPRMYNTVVVGPHEVDEKGIQQQGEVNLNGNAGGGEQERNGGAGKDKNGYSEIFILNYFDWSIEMGGDSCRVSPR